MPKFTTITLGETNIEFYNSLFGKERIVVNGEEVSVKKSLKGTEHNFSVKESEETVQYKLITGVNFNGVAISLYRNDHPVIESPKRGLWGLIITGFVIVALGYLLGRGIL